MPVSNHGADINRRATGKYVLLFIQLCIILVTHRCFTTEKRAPLARVVFDYTHVFE